MPFNPKSLDPITLKRLAERLHEALAAEPTGQVNTLARAQELIARTFSNANWNAALIAARRNPTRPDAPSSGVSVGAPAVSASDAAPKSPTDSEPTPTALTDIDEAGMMALLDFHTVAEVRKFAPFLRSLPLSCTSETAALLNDRVGQRISALNAIAADLHTDVPVAAQSSALGKKMIEDHLRYVEKTIKRLACDLYVAKRVDVLRPQESCVGAQTLFFDFPLSATPRERERVFLQYDKKLSTVDLLPDVVINDRNGVGVWVVANLSNTLAAADHFIENVTPDYCAGLKGLVGVHPRLRAALGALSRKMVAASDTQLGGADVDGLLNNIGDVLEAIRKATEFSMVSLGHFIAPDDIAALLKKTAHAEHAIAQWTPQEIAVAPVKAPVPEGSSLAKRLRDTSQQRAAVISGLKRLGALEDHGTPAAIDLGHAVIQSIKTWDASEAELRKDEEVLRKALAAPSGVSVTIHADPGAKRSSKRR